MHFRIVLSQFWRDLKANRQRTALTLFGLAWGTFCIIALLSFGEGIHRSQGRRMEAMGDRLLLIWGSRTSLAFEGLPRGRYIRLVDADADLIEGEVADVEGVVPEYEIRGMMKGPKGEGGFGVSGVRPIFGEMRKIEPSEGGRFLNDRDEAERRRVAVLGHQVHQDLFGGEPAIGQTFSLNGIPFLVIGTLAEKDQDSNYNGPDDRKVFIPASTIQASLGARYPDNLVVSLSPLSDSKEAQKAILAVMGRRHHFDPADDEALAVWDVGEMVAEFSKVFIGFKAFLGILGVLTLVVAGIGVANIMNMAIEDRTVQIGISMALGARRRWVLSQVLLETLLVTAVGGGAGVLFAALVVAGAQHLPLEDSIGAPVFSWQIALLTATLLGLLGVISGLPPARRAAYLNPAEALRT